MCQALDIAIPPPRPKRKPSNPYPRKTASGTISMLKTCENDGKEESPSEVIFMAQWHLLVLSCIASHVIVFLSDGQ